MDQEALSLLCPILTISLQAISALLHYLRKAIMSIRLTDIIKPFRGEGADNIETWLEKLELVAKLQAVKEKEHFLPLFLEGPAFAVYQQFSEEVKNDYNNLCSGLLAAFAANEFSAYEQFSARKYNEGEGVDVYLADLRRLAMLFGSTEERTLRCAFVVGLPEYVSKQLRALSNIESLRLSDIVSRARYLVADCANITCASGVRKNNTHRSLKDVICYRCDKKGHIARFCRERRRQGNDKGEDSLVPAASPQEH